MIYLNKYDSPIGELTLASDGERLTGLWIRNQKYYMYGAEDQVIHTAILPVLELAKAWLDDYFAGSGPDPFQLELAPQGSNFSREIWSLLREIPYGKVCTYGEIAGKYAEKHGLKSMSAQAVGGAVGHNPISIIIPCHRVVGRGGKLTGYAGGLEIKQKLLELESAGTGFGGGDFI